METESGEKLANVVDPNMLLSSVASGAIDLSDTVCLRFLDAYGDACFNQLQIPILVGEIENVATIIDDPQVSRITRKWLIFQEIQIRSIRIYGLLVIEEL